MAWQQVLAPQVLVQPGDKELQLGVHSGELTSSALFQKLQSKQGWWHRQLQPLLLRAHSQQDQNCARISLPRRSIPSSCE